MKTYSKHREIIEMGPFQEEVGRAFLQHLSATYKWMPSVPDDLLLEKVTLSVRRKRSLTTVEEPPSDIALGTWEGPQKFEAAYAWVRLQEFGMDGHCTPWKHVATLMLGHPDSPEPPVIPLTLHRFLCMLAMVTRNGEVDSELISEQGPDAVTITGEELSDCINRLGEERGLPPDSVVMTDKELGDCIRWTNKAIENRGLPRFVLGSPKRGFRLDVYPGNIHFIPPSQLPMNRVRE